MSWKDELAEIKAPEPVFRLPLTSQLIKVDAIIHGSDGNRACRAIIDNGSFINAISPLLVAELGLETRPL